MVIGAGGHARTVIETAGRFGQPVGGILDEAREEGEDVLGVPLVGDRSSYPRYQQDCSFMVAIGDNLGRKEFFDLLKTRKAKCTTLIHPEAHVDPSTPVGHGTLVDRGAMLCPNGNVGENVIVNSRALLEHDHHIGDHAHIGPDVALAGGVTVGEGSFIGLKSVVRDGIKIGSWCTIGAGSVVVADVPDGATVIGNPGRIVSIESTPSENRPRREDPLLPISSTLREALEKIDLWGTGFAFVENKNKVEGLITDGMIRRFFLSQGHLEDPVTQLMNKDFIHLQKGQEGEAPHLFSSKVHFIPVLSEEKNLLKVIYRDDIFTSGMGESQSESRQMRDLFHWVTHRGSPLYQIDFLQKKLTKIWPAHSPTPVASAQEALEVYLGENHASWSPDVMEWWPGGYTQAPPSPSGPREELPIVLYREELKGKSSTKKGLILTGQLSSFEDALSQLPKGWGVLLRGSPEDNLNLEGGAIIAGEGFPSLPSPHPLQLASGASRLKSWFRKLEAP